MAKRGNRLHILQAFVLSRLLLILIIFMIASLFGVLLIKGSLYKNRQAGAEPRTFLTAACCPATDERKS